MTAVEASVSRFLPFVSRFRSFPKTFMNESGTR